MHGFRAQPSTVLSRLPLCRTLLTATVAAVLPLLAPAPALSAGRDDGGGAEPPAKMSTVGGERLGLPGTQVDLGTGAPRLPKDLTGRSWIVADAESGEVLAAHNAHWELAPASTLKMLFADTVLPHLPKDEVHKVVPSDLADVGPGSSLVGIKEGLSYSVHDLWLGVFLRSGNDAVHVLSEMYGGTEKAVRDMQEHAKELNALDTHVVTPDGYDEKGQVSSAYDLTLFARSGLQKADFREYCSTARAQFPGKEKKAKKGEKPKRETFEIQNTNRLLTGDVGLEPYDGMAGVKNGYTSNAGSTFTGVAQRGDRVLLTTVMNPASNEGLAVYREAGRLLDWGFKAADKVEPVGTLVAPKTAETGKAGSEAGGKEGRPEKNPHGPGPVSASAAEDPSAGMWTALGVAGGSLVVLGAGAMLVHRRWPLPELVRREPRD
ncbi:D-alanyl-D-alanine carboxypeptidase family protein [Streptomyces sp. TP-A0874]|uniref:D-alanyl-D-alanine carboxypeptidase family protein n=1 Tax=Streptomyces sp. TP-A0874 TaxID=549819 RepID=UPI000AF616BC|nr:D-alanyl-D-alanine carboxypeptidase [Streptomyces sp. TP-A0874]